MNEHEKDKLFVELSIDLGFINAADAAAAFQEQKIDEAVGAKKPVGAYLVASGCSLAFYCVSKGRFFSRFLE